MTIQNEIDRPTWLEAVGKRLQRWLGTVDRKSHWEEVYSTQSSHSHGWFQTRPDRSLEWVERFAPDPSAGVLDVGGGDSRLVDLLLERGYQDLTVLDLSGGALKRSRERLGSQADRVTWLEADVTKFRPTRHYNLWHDRAVFHFLITEQGRTGYKRALLEAVPVGGKVIIATFSPRGPRRCSGLPICRYSAETLARELGDGLELEGSQPEIHTTPGGQEQHFEFSEFRRV
jgi:hypothetical protein